MSNSWKLADDLITESHQSSLRNRGYKIVAKLNEGSYASIFLGEFICQSAGGTPTATKQLAVKVLDSKRKPTNLTNKFFAREINILSQIEHPHIIHIHSILQIGTKFYIFMRLAEQGDLLDFILKYGNLKEGLARIWTRQIAAGLQYLHTLNIAHRDLKSENILVTANYNVKLSDFGFARYTVDDQKKSILSSTYCGTLMYAPPEVLQGLPYNPKSADLWSFGVIVYVMLNKSLPFADHNAKSLFENQWKRNFKFGANIAGLLSNEVKILITDLLEPNPVNRCNIEGVIKSDWIAMDKSLLAFPGLSPLEIAAVANIFAQKITPSIKVSLPLFKTKRKQALLDGNALQASATFCEIKPYEKLQQVEKSEDLVRGNVALMENESHIRSQVQP